MLIRELPFHCKFMATSECSYGVPGGFSIPNKSKPDGEPSRESATTRWCYQILEWPNSTRYLPSEWPNSSSSRTLRLICLMRNPLTLSPYKKILIVWLLKNARVLAHEFVAQKNPPVAPCDRAGVKAVSSPSWCRLELGCSPKVAVGYKPQKCVGI